MTVSCTPCGRSFKEQKDLAMHIQNSSVHRTPNQKAPRGKDPVAAVKVQPVIVRSSQQVSHFRNKPVVPQQVLNTSSRVQATPIRKHEQTQSTIASSSRTSSIPKSTAEIAAQDRVWGWSEIPASEYTAVLSDLSAHCHSQKQLEENSYIVRPYKPSDYVGLRKCKLCNGQEKKVTGRECTYHLSNRNKRNLTKPYKCCLETDGRGCRTSPTHDFQLPLRALSHKDYQATPPTSAASKVGAVALDCEMAGIASGAGEAIFLCATDYVTGAVLVNRFVCPRNKIIDMRTSTHGISYFTLERAISRGEALSGWEGARAELWKYIDENTILVGHALQHDLDCLRIIHPRIVDSGILAKNAIGIGKRMWGLQTLCSELLSLEIRQNKGGIHDCLEDVLATREVVLFCTKNKAGLGSWSEVKRKAEMEVQKEREQKRLEKERQKALQEKGSNRVTRGFARAEAEGSYGDYFEFEEDEDDEIVHWSDIAEDLGWPHPDTGYDPWSD